MIWQVIQDDALVDAPNSKNRQQNHNEQHQESVQGNTFEIKFLRFHNR
jgi:hypothetical protein